MKRLAVVLIVIIVTVGGAVYAQQQQPEMTPIDALTILDRAVSTVEADRQTHITLQRAVNTLGGALQELEKLQAAAAVYEAPEVKAE